MTPKATIRDVAAEAGVSVATVSRAIHHNGYISKENQERIDEAIKKLGYVERRSSKEVPAKAYCPIAVALLKSAFSSDEQPLNAY